MRVLFILIALFYCNIVWSDDNWKVPNDNDRESACRTILFEVEASTEIKEILLLKRTYKLLCDNRFEDKNSIYSNAFIAYSKYMEELDQSPSLTNKVACIDSHGYVNPKSGNWWNHKELEKYYYFNEQTNGGWDHMEIQSYLNARPLLQNLDSEDVSALEQFVKSGLKIEDVNRASQLWKLEAFKKSSTDIQDINNRIDSLNLEQLENIQLNK